MVAGGRGCQHGDVDLQDLERRAARFDTAAGTRQLRIAIFVLLFLSMSTCLAKGANGPVDPRLVQAATLPPFEQIAFRIAPPGEKVTTPTPASLLCALLADTAWTRERNLNGRGDLAGYAALVIDQGTSSSTPFTPRAISLATSLAFFNGEGAFVGAADVEPCAAQGGCPPVAPPGPYRYLVITPRGHLAAWGAVAGSHLQLAEKCPPPDPAPAPAPPPG